MADDERPRPFRRWVRGQVQFVYLTRLVGLAGFYNEVFRRGGVGERPFTLLLVGVMILGGEVVGQVLSNLRGKE